MKSDVALAIFPSFAFGVRRRDPEQGLAVAPAGHVLIIVFELEAEKAEQLAVIFLRARELADAENQMIDTDDFRHGIVR